MLDYDRTYIVKGAVVSPFRGPAKRLRGQAPPELSRLPLPFRVVAPVSQQTPVKPSNPANSSARKPATTNGQDADAPIPTGTGALRRAASPPPVSARAPSPLLDDDEETF